RGNLRASQADAEPAEEHGERILVARTHLNSHALTPFLERLDVPSVLPGALLRKPTYRRAGMRRGFGPRPSRLSISAATPFEPSPSAITPADPPSRTRSGTGPGDASNVGSSTITSDASAAITACLTASGSAAISVRTCPSKPWLKIRFSSARRTAGSGRGSDAVLVMRTLL